MFPGVNSAHLRKLKIFATNFFVFKWQSLVTVNVIKHLLCARSQCTFHGRFEVECVKWVSAHRTLHGSWGGSLRMLLLQDLPWSHSPALSIPSPFPSPCPSTLASWRHHMHACLGLFFCICSTARVPPIKMSLWLTTSVRVLLKS